jgi:predicted Zn-dependent peptidase
MKIRLFIATCLLAVGMSATAKDYKYQTVPNDPMQTRIYTLDNGLKVYLSVNKERPRIQANIAVRTGSRNDPAETTGLAHYLEHLMFKGTKQFGVTDPAAEAPLLDEIEARYEVYRTLTDPAQRKKAYHEIDSISQLAAKYFIPNEYDKLMSAIGSQGTNAYTSTDVTCYVENIPSNEVENWARVQGDRFQNMVIRGFHTELEAVYEEKNIGMAQDSRKVWEALYAKLFPSHPYGTQTTIGTQEHLKNPSITNIKNYFKRYYVPNNVAICMAGDFNPDEVIAIIDKYFGSWKRSDNLSIPQFPAQPEITNPIDTTVVGKEAEMLMMGWRFDAGNSAQNDTLAVIADMLTNGKAGMLEVDLEHTMKIQGVSAFCDQMTDYSMFVLYGVPNAGQSLEELRGLLVDEMKKFQRGEFDKDLLESVLNNKKLNFYRSLDDNNSRVSMMVNSYINHEEWADVVAQIDRQSKMTVDDIVSFAKRHLNDNYVCVFKKIGTDETQVKIEKPEITPIPTNRELSSEFLNSIKNSYVKPIEARFVDFNKDLTETKTKKGLPLLYKQNNTDGLFNLAFYYNFGDEADNEMSYAANYLSYIGTDKKTITQINQEFYKLACNFRVSVGNDMISVSLSGLNENMPQALALLEDLLHNAKADNESYASFLDLLQKQMDDSKMNQQANFSALRDYVMYGPYNSTRNIIPMNQLRSMDPQKLVDRLKDLNKFEHTVLYYGPMSEKDLDKLLSKTHKTMKKMQPVPVNKEYTMTLTPSNEVYIAPYEAKNIYMIQYHNENKPFDVNNVPVISLFNEYFGGGMNSIVFQELRESRGLAYSSYANYSYPSRNNHPESYFTYIVSQNDKMMDCIKVFNEIITDMPKSEAAFGIAKQSLTKSIESSRTTKFNILNSYYLAKKRGFTEPLVKKIYNALPSLTLQDILNFENKNMVGKTYKYIILGDEKELDMDALEKIGPVHRLTTEEIFGY